MPQNMDQEDRPPPLTESPNSLPDFSTRQDSPSDPDHPSTSFVMIPGSQQNKHAQASRLVPYTRPLTINDLDSVVALENAAFTDPNERASEEKASSSCFISCLRKHRFNGHLRYRLSKCGELCLGLFCTMEPGSDSKAETLATGRPVETSRKDGAVCVLIGHVIAAKTNASIVTDQSMDFPKDWASNPSISDIGHQEAGRTICLHSVAILPEFQGRGLGRVLLLAYMQQMNGAGIADRLALLAHDVSLRLSAR
ncbi:hypothetical protein BP6252_04402 [Coleophoma cylindrospora]|uniref:N-acetyltransferase domain-containing protein n=1 Tax=Coleophoma cylindrospora TaxID=1849047 RepID=A0A3D8S0Z6_9HELO|nr:hypothetical protein BP6252_04402 [Coleophoma cylindrospora]